MPRRRASRVMNATVRRTISTRFAGSKAGAVRPGKPDNVPSSCRI
jgi:hypothetical protein